MSDTFHRRSLPDDATEFSSPLGRQLFAEALASGGLEGYFRLAEQFHTQAEPQFCGLGSLVVALNAMGIDPARRVRRNVPVGDERRIGVARVAAGRGAR